MPLLPDLSQSALLVVDLQERLVPAMCAEEQNNLLKQAKNLIAAMRHTGGRVLYSEQYPRGLGSTVPSVLNDLNPEERLEKVAFSVLAAESFPANAALPTDVILCGIEAHVCVLLTAQDLLEKGHVVWVPFDAVSSRDPAYKNNALELLKEAGAKIVNTETLIFSMLKRAGSPEFKTFSKMIR